MFNTVFAVWKNWESMKGIEALVVSLIAILIVFLVLILVILISEGLFKATSAVEAKNHIKAREENKILDEDSDAAIAVIAATIDFHREFNKDVNVVSVTKED